jgi:hypothetical protein
VHISIKFIFEHILWYYVISEQVLLLKITKIGYYLKKIVPGEVSWPLGPPGKLFLAGGRTVVSR